MSELGLTVIIGVLLILIVLGLVVWLLLLNNARRINHRAELAERDLARDRSVMQAEREARQQTMAQIGRELHDDLGQLLTVVEHALEAVHTERPDQRLEEAMDTLERITEEVRLLGRSLNADMWGQRSFSEALGTETARMRRAGITQLHLERSGDWPELDPGKKTILFRVFQELVNNALKHGKQAVIHVRLEGTPTPALIVEDDGPGFSPDAMENANGLSNIRHRCGLIGFRAELATAPGQGCRWRIVKE